MARDKRKHPRQLANFGFNLHDLTKHGSYTYLWHGNHKCKNCILKATKKCDVYVQQNLKPDTECPIIEAYTSDMVSQIMELDHIRSEDITTVTQLARSLGFIAIANKYLNEMGLFKLTKDKSVVGGLIVDVQPLVKAIQGQENLIAKLTDQLGLTPRSRQVLKIKDGPDLSKMIQKVMEED